MVIHTPCKPIYKCIQPHLKNTSRNLIKQDKKFDHKKEERKEGQREIRRRKDQSFWVSISLTCAKEN